MAENIRWILEREERIVIGAHNGHIQRAPLQGLPMLGQILAHELGKEMVVVGTTFAAGQIVDLRSGAEPGQFATGLEESGPPEPQTIDALMEAARSAPHFVDLCRVPAGVLRAATAMRLATFTIDLDLKQAFDALIHIPRIAPVRGAFETLRDSIARAAS
jgi:erythromycin esterase-like protein